MRNGRGKAEAEELGLRMEAAAAEEPVQSMAGLGLLREVGVRAVVEVVLPLAMGHRLRAKPPVLRWLEKCCWLVRMEGVGEEVECGLGPPVVAVRRKVGEAEGPEELTAPTKKAVAVARWELEEVLTAPRVRQKMACVSLEAAGASCQWGVEGPSSMP